MEPDIRFSLANERTFLAYVRTSVGLVAGGLAVFHLIDPSWAQRALAAVLVATSLVAALNGWWRYRRADRAIRANEPFPASAAVHVITLGVLVVVLLAGLSVVL